MNNVHINIPKGKFIGQVRKAGHRLWNTVTDESSSAEDALHKMAPHMFNHARGRVLFVDESGYYEPNIVMEINRK